MSYSRTQCSASGESRTSNLSNSSLNTLQLSHHTPPLLHTRLDCVMETNNIFPREQSDLGLCCLQYRLPKNISRQEEQTTKIVPGRKRVL